MKILLSPVGMQDPHGKEDRVTGVTFGSIVAICALTKPDRVILLPTRSRHGDDTYNNAEKTQEELEASLTPPSVEIDPQDMDAANDYEEALRVYSDALTRWARKYPDAELIVNVSSGTPAIKLACMLTIAEGRIPATPWYADDPTKTQRTDPVRPINVTFLRESALMQRVCDLLVHGQFALAQEPLEELHLHAYSPDLRQWAGYWTRLIVVLQYWDKRNYREALGRLRTLLREWKSLPPELAATLQQQQTQLDALARNNPDSGVLAWDLYFQARRLHEQQRLAMAMEAYWTAIENVTFERAEQQGCQNTNNSNFQLYHAIRYLLDQNDAPNDAPMKALWQQPLSGHTVEHRQDPLRKIRNKIVHKGHVPTSGETNETRELAQHWLIFVGSAMPSNYPLAPETLQQLAALFNSDCGR